MARLHLVLSTAPDALLDAAAAAFLDPPAPDPARPFLTPAYLLVLRQGGLRDDLFARAAERGVRGWFDPPLCVFRQLPEWLGATDREPLGDYERLVLVSRAVREAAGDVFGRLRRPDAFMDAVDRLFGEWVSEGVDADTLAAAMEGRPSRDAFEEDRDRELAAAYRAYLARLRETNQRDGRDWLVDAARAAQDADALADRLGGRREIRIVGLQDLKGGWPVLLGTLAGSSALDRVAIYTTTAVELPGVDMHVEVLEDGGLAGRLFGGTAWAGAPGTTAEATAAPGNADAAGQVDGSVEGLPLFEAAPDGPGREGAAGAENDVSPIAGRAPAVDMVSAPDAAREVEEVARRVRLLVDEGVAPHRIAVVARHARPFLDRAVAALRRVGLPVTARQRVALAEIPVVRSVLALVRVAAEGWTRHGLVELAEQPYLGVDLDVRVLNHIGYRGRVEGLDAWSEALDALHAEALEWERLREDDEASATDRRSAPPAAERVASARDAFRDFAVQARELDAERPLAEWLDWLERFVDDDPWSIEPRIYRVPEDRVEVARLDAAGWTGIRKVVGEWCEAVRAWDAGGEVLGPTSFEARLREMLSGDAALWTETQRGVQVLEALAAAFRVFDHVFVLGLEGGRFPHPMPRSPILDEYDREALAGAIPMELRSEWDAREREAFRTVVAGARETLTLSHARLDTLGAEIVRSTFIDEVESLAVRRSEEIPGCRVLTPGMPVLAHEDVGHAARVARVERDRQTGRPGPHNGLIEAPELLAWLDDRFGDDRVWSPTQLEGYAKCPWAFFSGRLLHLEKQEDPDADMDPRVRGTVLHAALRRFYDAAVERLGGPVFLREPELEWSAPLMADALDAALAEAGGVWLGHPALRPAKRLELERTLQEYLAFEVGLAEDMYSTRKRKAPKILRTGVAAHELGFEDVVLETGGVRFRFRGWIDRVEEGIDERVDASPFLAAVDYKTSRYSAPAGGDDAGWDDDVVLQVPLYAHALRRLRPDRRVARVEYRAIRQRQTVHSLELVQVEGDRLVENEEAARRMERALASVGEHVRAAREGVFPARPAPSCKCPPFCHAWDICRVAGGPETKR